MKSSQEIRNRRALEAFGEFPPEVAALGRPISVHSPNAMARLAVKGIPKTLSMVLMFGLLLIGLILTIPYFQGISIGTGPPFVWLMIAALFILCGVGVGLSQREFARRNGESKTPKRFLVYKDALVQFQDGSFTVIRWDQVKELRAPVNAKCWRLVGNDGRQIDLTSRVERDGDLIQTTIEHATASLLPQYWATLEAGKKVMFGKFGVSKRAVYYKDKKLPWKDVTQMTLVTGKVYGLKIYGGGLGIVPWCFYDLNRDPNGQVAYELVRRVAPERLLKQG